MKRTSIKSPAPPTTPTQAATPRRRRRRAASAGRWTRIRCGWKWWRREWGRDRTYRAWDAKAMYDFSCEHCDGTVRERRVDREALRHKGNFVILENVPIGVCDK